MALQKARRPQHLQRQPSRRKKRLPWRRMWVCGQCLMGCVLLGGMLWGGMKAYRVLTNVAYFRVRTINITGNTMLTRQQILYLLAIPPGATLFQLDLVRMGTRLERHPYIKTVKLRRRFPDTLTVVVQERQPVLRVVAGAHQAVLDAEGIVLRAFDARRDSSLPQLALRQRRALVPGMHIREWKVQRALALMRTYRKLPISRLIRLIRIRIESSGASVWQIAPYPFRLRLGEGKVDKQLRRLPVVLAYIAQRHLPVRLIDLSYRQRIIVTPQG